MSAIQVRLTIAYPGFSLPLEIDLPGRGVTALFGPSGTGKTSILRAIAGLERHPGYLSVNGQIWQDDAQRQFVPPHRRPLGFVFQEASLLPHLTVKQNLEFGFKRAGKRVTLDMAACLELLGIGHLLARHPQHLSGGERQRVAIGRALLADPALLLMDEPLAALDAARKQELLPYLERVRSQLDIPMIYVSHAPEEVARLADHIVLLDAGKVLASGPIAGIMARLDLPTALSEDAAMVIDGTVAGYDAHYQLIRVRIGAHEVQVAHRELPIGTALRCRILARDVSLSLAPHADSSILNQLPAKVLSEAPAHAPAHVMVLLDIGGARLLARITRQARDRLGIAPGMAVVAQFKAVAVLSAHY